MNPLPFQIKICGVTTPEDAQTVVRAGAEAIGLNFYPQSKRFVTLTQAGKIAAAIPKGVFKVGVFVNPSVESVTAALEQLPLDFVQFHGDESPDFLAQFTSLPAIKAFRWQPDFEPMVSKFLDRCSALQFELRALLIDAFVTGEFGGTGKTTDWQAIAQWRSKQRSSITLVLAGGLNPKNIGDAISTVGPDAVDTASGVELSLGRKDARLTESFVVAACRAFAALGQ